MSPIRLTMDKRHFMSYLFYQVLEFNVIGILHKIKMKSKKFCGIFKIAELIDK